MFYKKIWKKKLTVTLLSEVINFLIPVGQFWLERDTTAKKNKMDSLSWFNILT